jgi:hypothetical protein
LQARNCSVVKSTSACGVQHRELRFFFQAFLQSIERKALALYGDTPYIAR